LKAAERDLKAAERVHSSSWFLLNALFGQKVHFYYSAEFTSVFTTPSFFINGGCSVVKLDKEVCWVVVT